MFFYGISRFPVLASAEAFICWIIANSDMGIIIFMQWGEKRMNDDTPFEHQRNHGTGLGRKFLCSLHIYFANIYIFILFNKVSLSKKKKEKFVI